MTIFLTSTHTKGWAGDLNTANGLADELRTALTGEIRCLVVTSYPDDTEITDRMAWEIRECFERADMPFAHYEVLDRRTQRYAARMFRQTNFIILCGGHVATENKFFKEIRLRQRLENWDGVMLTISAGSMNSADIVFATPELEGEAIDPGFKTYMRGLGLTDINILPHFQTLESMKIDGLRLMEDIVAYHSFMHPVYCLPDGSYFLITPERTEMRGLMYRMSDGELKKVCGEGRKKLYKPSQNERKELTKQA